MAERRISAVPGPVLIAFAALLAAQVSWQSIRPAPTGRAEELAVPPPELVLRVASLGEPIALAQWLTLYLQAFDNQPGISLPFLELDYPRVIRWLEAVLGLDPIGQYPLMMASQLYTQVPDEQKQRQMMSFVHRQFLRDPDRRWRWLAHCAIMAKHRLRDLPLALRYAEDISRYARGASDWARQMRIFILADLGETESAAVLLGGLLESGEVTDHREIQFLTQRLEELKNAGKSSPLPKNRR